MVRSTAKNPGGRGKKPSKKSGAELTDNEMPRHLVSSEADDVKAADAPEKCRRNGGWREIEALREKAALKASLADVWDEDFDLDEEILAELDHTAEFFTTQEEPEEEEIFEDDDEVDEYYEDDEA